VVGQEAQDAERQGGAGEAGVEAGGGGERVSEGEGADLRGGFAQVGAHHDLPGLAGRIF
jgi:hypothetical protein